MRTARPVGLSQDGKSLIVETGDGDRIAVLADAGLRDLLRNRPRPQLEIEMESALTPREIQMKIRAGASVEELAEASGMPVNRVEAFAAPVIAEREHIAGLAQSGSVRRTGESTGHRTLRAALTQRLRELKIDPETIVWDSYKMDDGRWSVSAKYRVEQSDRHAVFLFDQRGRFSLADNDEARWAIGEELDRPADDQAEETDSEPTLKLASSEDELALLRSVETEHFTENVTRDESADDESADEEAGTAPSIGLVEDDSDQRERVAASETDVEESDESTDEPEPAADASPPSEPEVTDEVSQLDLLYDLLGADGYAEDSIRVYQGLSDGAAVPDVADGGWSPPTDESGADEPTVDESTAAQPVIDDSEPESAELADGAAQDALPVGLFDEAVTEDAPVEEAAEIGQPVDSAVQTPTPDPGDDATTTAPDAPAAVDVAEEEVPASAPEPDPKPKPKPKKKKRAAVPSWDEIMFGSPKSK